MPENCADESSAHESPAIETPADDDAQWLFAGDPQTHAASLTERFTEVFGRAAQGVWFAPGRANLNGEHIDFHGGRCLPMALRYGTYAAAAPRTDGLLRLRTLEPTLDTGIVEICSADVTRTDAGWDQESDVADWTRYVSGVVWAMQQLIETAPELALAQSFGADVLIRSTVPIGAGLSSSASLECAAALAFTALGTPLGRANPGDGLARALTDEHRAALAQACIRAEVEVVGAGTGGLDQTTSLRAAEGTLLSLDCRDFSLVGTDVSFLLDKHRFLAVDTGQPHALATSEFADRRAESEAAAAVLGVGRLRDALPETPRQAHVDQALQKYDDDATSSPALTGLDPAACRRRLEHALTEMLRSERIHALLTDGPEVAHHDDRTAALLGEILTAGHASMRDNARVSFPIADQVVETVLAHGALGARLIGGGFGGSVLVLLPRAGTERITTAAAELSPDIRFLAVDPSSAAHMV
ncbi:galactokinase [Garicola koreensis]|uniref:galactokinase n=1 Tax=Garicola koreensis TaxID=1262554 RepID=UPI0031E87D54